MASPKLTRSHGVSSSPRATRHSMIFSASATRIAYGLSPASIRFEIFSRSKINPVRCGRRSDFNIGNVRQYVGICLIFDRIIPTTVGIFPMALYSDRSERSLDEATRHRGAFPSSPHRQLTIPDYASLHPDYRSRGNQLVPCRIFDVLIVRDSSNTITWQHAISL